MSQDNPPKIHPVVDANGPVDPSEGRPGFVPNLPIREWVTYGLLAAALAVTNIYTTLKTGWGDGGSLIAVVAAAGILGAMRRRAHIHSLNLGQTMASAGGTVGFAAVSYAAVKMAYPSFEANAVLLILMFIGMAMIGVVIGSTVRKRMVGYYFPSGTACAVIQKTVTSTDGGDDARRPVRLLGIYGAIGAALATLHTVQVNGKALLHALSWKLGNGQSVGADPDPVLFGIGVVVGPRIGLGMLLGALITPFIIDPALASNGGLEHIGDWKNWTAISLLSLPTFATLIFAYFFRVPASVPAGFSPGKVEYPTPPARNLLYGAFLVIGLGLTAVTASALFDLSWHVTILVVALCWPLAIMNGRVTGETDINPVRLVIIVVLTLFALALSTTAVMLLGMTIMASMLAGMAVDMMQDYRTGYLVNANPHHQTTVQFIGVLVGALVAVPFILLLDSQIGFGTATFPAPGPTVYVQMVESFTGGAYWSSNLMWGIIGVSVAGSVYAFMTVWPATARFMPSLFGAGIGMLLPFEASATIFIGGLVKWSVSMAYTKGTSGEARTEAANRAQNDTMLVGSALFAAAAIMAVVLIVVSAVFGWPTI